MSFHNNLQSKHLSLMIIMFVTLLQSIAVASSSTWTIENFLSPNHVAKFSCKTESDSKLTVDLEAFYDEPITYQVADENIAENTLTWSCKLEMHLKKEDMGLPQKTGEFEFESIKGLDYSFVIGYEYDEGLHADIYPSRGGKAKLSSIA